MNLYGEESVSYSIQRAVSDGSLNRVAVSLAYLDKSDITVWVDDIQIPETGASQYPWHWDGDDIVFDSPIPNDIEVLVRRSTNRGAVQNVFSGRAEFSNKTMDENFTQMLYLAQEYSEGSGLRDVFSDINMHGYKITNTGFATEDDDVVTLKQYREDAEGAKVARDEAETAQEAAEAAQSKAEAAANVAEGAIDSIESARDTAVGVVRAEGTTQSEAVEAKGTSEIQRVQEAASAQIQLATEQATIATQKASTATSEADRAHTEAERAKEYAENASAGQINSDWAETDSSQMSYIKNKPTLGALASKDSIDYSELTGTPPEVDLSGYATNTALSSGLATKVDTSTYTTDKATFLTKTEASTTYLGKTEKAASSTTSDDAQSILQAFIEFAQENGIE